MPALEARVPGGAKVDDAPSKGAAIDKQHRSFYDGLDTDGAGAGDAPFALHVPGEKSVAVGGIERAEHVRRAVIGRDAVFATPYGAATRLVYADWAASGRALQPIEDYIQHQVLPFYANTHTTTSITGLQSTCFRLEARQAIAQACNARVGYSDKHSDVVLFVGSGSTGAINKMVSILGLNAPLPAGTPSEARPVVLVGPFEHHSNILPWRESHAEVVMIPEGPGGRADKAALAAALSAYASRPLVIGSFSAASNVTGVAEDVDGVTEQLHRAGALAFWDYASAAPYAEVDMNPVRLAPGGGQNPYVYKDAVFVSTHKLAGGPGAPGILVAKRRIFSNDVPGEVGGGTVFYVTGEDHRYLSNREEREEGGTQDVVGSIRAGLAFQIKQAVGVPAIAKAEEALAARLHAALATAPGMHVLGPEYEAGSGRLPIISFVIKAPAGVGAPGAAARLLHYNFVCALLNDLFGVQARGGCACAGPYVHNLLGISATASRRIEEQLLDKAEALRPGFSRISLPYFASEAEVAYVIEAVKLVAEFGWRLLPAYRVNPKTGEWKHHTRVTKFPNRQWLGHMRWPAAAAPAPPAAAAAAAGPAADAALERAWAAQQAAGREVLMRGSIGEAKPSGGGSALGAFSADGGDLGSEDLRWFVYPWEADERMRAGGGAPDVIPPPGAESAFQEPSEILGPLQPKVYTPHGIAAAAAAAGGECTEEVCLPCMKMRAPQAEGVTVGATAGALAPAAVSSKYPSRAGGAEGRSPGWAAAPATAAAAPADPTAGVAAGATAGTAGGGGMKVKKDKKTGLYIPPTKILKPVGNAIADWGMIKEGDKILLGLSGGKDSLAMLHVLMHLQRKSPVKFELAAATVDPGTEAFNPRPLIPYMDSLGVKYHYLEQNIMEDALCSMDGDSICAFCARMKRGALYKCCRDNGYTSLVLAQHLDDLAESFVMSALHNGQARTMKAAYTIDAGDVKVIRPFVYVRERTLKEFSYAAGLPVINENCPACFEAPQERQHVKKLLAREEAKFPDTFTTLCTALIPFMDNDLYYDMDKVQKDVMARRKASGSKGQIRPQTHEHGVNIKREARLAGGEEAPPPPPPSPPPPCPPPPAPPAVEAPAAPGAGGGAGGEGGAGGRMAPSPPGGDDIGGGGGAGTGPTDRSGSGPACAPSAGGGGGGGGGGGLSTASPPRAPSAGALASWVAPFADLAACAEAATASISTVSLILGDVLGFSLATAAAAGAAAAGGMAGATGAVDAAADIGGGLGARTAWMAAGAAADAAGGMGGAAGALGAIADTAGVCGSFASQQAISGIAAAADAAGGGAAGAAGVAAAAGGAAGAVLGKVAAVLPKRAPAAAPSERAPPASPAPAPRTPTPAAPFSPVTPPPRPPVPVDPEHMRTASIAGKAALGVTMVTFLAAGVIVATADLD